MERNTEKRGRAMKTKYNDWLLKRLLNLRALYDAADCGMARVSKLRRVRMWLEYHLLIRLPYLREISK